MVRLEKITSKKAERHEPTVSFAARKEFDQPHAEPDGAGMV
jgi:hypothetical protein